MAVTIYRSTDASAPVLTGQVGTLVALLDACLVTGYGAKAAAGWTKPYTSTNAAAFRQGGTGIKMYLQVDDNAPNGTVGARQARVWGWEGMSAYGVSDSIISSVHGSFPNYSGGEYSLWRKSTTADATARPWIVAADERTVHLYLKTGDHATGYWPFTFGDFYSYISDDDYRCGVFGFGNDSSFPSYYPGTIGVGYFTFQSSYNAGCWIPRPYWGSYSAKRAGPIFPSQITINSYNGVSYNANANTEGMMSNPNADGKVYVIRYRIMEDIATTPANGGMTLRGEHRGIWHWAGHSSFTAEGDTFSGVVGGSLNGRTFLLIPVYNGLGGQIHYQALETSNTWDTST